MFKSITSGVIKKQKSFGVNYSQIEKVEEVFKTFLTKEYGEFSLELGITPSFDFKDNSLIVTTPSKTVACEINLKIGQLAKFFWEKGIKLNKIVIK